jgi:hypothetical protein
MGTPPDPMTVATVRLHGCEWAFDHWHRKEETIGLHDHSGKLRLPDTTRRPTERR